MSRRNPDSDDERRKRMKGLRPELVKVSPSELILHMTCLSQSEMEQIRCRDDNKGPMNAAQFLFDMLWKKERWYEQLLDALKETDNWTLADKLNEPEEEFLRSATSTVSPVSMEKEKSGSLGPILQETGSVCSTLEEEASLSRQFPTAPGNHNVASEQNDQNELHMQDARKEITGHQATDCSQPSGFQMTSPHSVSATGSSEATQPEVVSPAGNVLVKKSPAASTMPVNSPAARVLESKRSAADSILVEDIPAASASIANSPSVPIPNNHTAGIPIRNSTTTDSIPVANTQTAHYQVENVPVGNSLVGHSTLACSPRAEGSDIPATDVPVTQTLAPDFSVAYDPPLNFQDSREKHEARGLRSTAHGDQEGPPRRAAVSDPYIPPNVAGDQRQEGGRVDPHEDRATDVIAASHHLPNTGAESKVDLEKSECRGEPPNDIARNMDTSNNTSPQLQLRVGLLKSNPNKLNDLSPTKLAATEFNILHSPENNNRDSDQQMTVDSQHPGIPSSEEFKSLCTMDEDPQIMADLKNMNSEDLQFSEPSAENLETGEHPGDNPAQHQREAGRPPLAEGQAQGGILHSLRGFLQVAADTYSEFLF